MTTDLGTIGMVDLWSSITFLLSVKSETWQTGSLREIAGIPEGHGMRKETKI